MLYLVKTYTGNEAWDLVFELVFAYELFEERELKASFAPFSLRNTQRIERQRQVQKDSGQLTQVTQLTYNAPLHRLVAAGPFGAVCWLLEFSDSVSGAAGWHQSEGTDSETDALQTEQLAAWETENQHRLRQQLRTQQALQSAAPALHRHEQLFTPLILLALSHLLHYFHSSISLSCSISLFVLSFQFLF